MADNVQWIKLKVGMFDGNSFKKIKRARIGGISYRDKLTAVWFELMDLAGKCNRDGYLIDNNEIPYHTYEDIATMLDRDEKEIELCMQFFINEKMVEIIDDIYCLTNFMQYQNQEGLEKIREQKRLRQARWRERKALGLIGSVDEKASTSASTESLPSISTSNSSSTSQSHSCSNSTKSKKERNSYNNIINEYTDDEETIKAIGEFIRFFNAKQGRYILNKELKTFLDNLSAMGLLNAWQIKGCIANGEIELAFVENYRE
jgi:predicted phage replisome organizer